MPLIQIEHVTKAYGSHDILRNISWTVNQGDRIGLVGRNGCGKTTLLHILTGQLKPDSGSVHRARGRRIGYLAQDPEFEPNATVLSTVLEGFGDLLELREKLRGLEARMADGDDSPETLKAYSFVHGQYEHHDGYTLEARASAILDGLGFPEQDQNLGVDILSGGQKNRLALARLLASGPDVLLLDEPTNHLDLRTIEWLERFLCDYEGAFIVISHDRYFLDRTAREVAEIENTRLVRYSGNFSFYAADKTRRLSQQRSAYEAQQAHIARTEDYIRRNIAGQKTKQAKSRRKALLKLDGVERPVDTKTVNLKFGTGKRGGDRVVQTEDISKTYGERTLFEGVNLIGWRNDRIGIVGPNGTGKTTLIKMLIGSIEPDDGWVRLGKNVQVGYYDQNRIDLNPGNTVLQEVWSVTPEATVTEIRTYLGAFLFSGDEVESRIRDLSGGEQSRVALAKLIRHPINLLVMDEPTNHLDIPSREALESALKQFDGTLIVVSHDRYFLNDLVTRLVVIEDGSHRIVEGNYDSLHQLWDAPSSTGRKKRPSQDIRQSKDRKGDEREAGRKQKRAEALEREIAELEKDIEKLDQELSRDDLASDWDKLKALNDEKTTLQKNIEARFAEWEGLETALRELEFE